jgi:hypothetical protein
MIIDAPNIEYGEAGKRTGKNVFDQVFDSDTDLINKINALNR